MIVECKQESQKGHLGHQINMVLSDGLMIVLALLMIPIAISPLLFSLSNSLRQTLFVADYFILAIFALEYFSKLATSDDPKGYVFNPWHILDLLVITLPLFDLLKLAGGFGRWSPILRLTRLTRVAVAGGRAIERNLTHPVPTVQQEPLNSLMKIRVMNQNMENVREDVPLEEVNSYLHNNSQTWIDIASIAQSDLDRLTKVLEIPRLVLESELVEESYPRIDYFDSYSMIFTRISEPGQYNVQTGSFNVNRNGLLVTCYGQNMITISRAETGLFSQISEKVKKIHGEEDSLVVSLLHTVLKLSLERDAQVIKSIEQALMQLECIPLRSKPANFLENTFLLKKEVNQLVPSLLHMKEVSALITSKQVPLEGFQEKDARLFDILADEATYLKETAENARENLLSLIDLYINTSSLQLNKVMRLVAVITSLSIIPAVAGLLGSNIQGNPWDIQLWQVFAVLGVLMISSIWVFYKLGWFK